MGMQTIILTFKILQSCEKQNIKTDRKDSQKYKGEIFQNLFAWGLKNVTHIIVLGAARYAPLAAKKELDIRQQPKWLVIYAPSKKKSHVLNLKSICSLGVGIIVMKLQPN